MENVDISSTRSKAEKQIRGWTLFIMIAIILSGITAFPLETELKWLDAHSSIFPEYMIQWIHKVAVGLGETNAAFPFLSYGTDWLAFAHLIIALLFVGVLRNPVKNKWVIDWAIACCILVFPLALIAGPIRQIPFFHQVIDCCFGFFGLIPLLIIRKKIKMLEV
ncbi:MAG: hypothetical protein ABI763_16025 [Bacteroidota bacterium]